MNRESQCHQQNSRPAVTKLSVRVQPRASENRIQLLADGTVRVRLTSPAVENKANEGLVELLSALLHVPKSAVRIVRGHAGRNKAVEISGRSWAEVIQAFPPTPKRPEV
ncbi:MAG: DUF167 domain-containing protein [Pseudomonadota bacterium]